MSEYGLAPIRPQQLEVNYVNWVADLNITDFFEPASNSRISDPNAGPFPEDQSWQARYLIKDPSGQPMGRLYVQCVPALRILPEPDRGTQFGLAYRVPTGLKTADDEIESAMAFGRDTIVRTFTDLTTEEAHKHWGRLK
jgi:hypothetical protein